MLPLVAMRSGCDASVGVSHAQAVWPSIPKHPLARATRHWMAEGGGRERALGEAGAGAGGSPPHSLDGCPLEPCAAHGDIMVDRDPFGGRQYLVHKVTHERVLLPLGEWLCDELDGGEVFICDQHSSMEFMCGDMLSEEPLR